MKYEISVLSPLHISDGQKISKNIDFILFRNKIKVFSFDKLLSFLEDEELTKIIDNNSNINIGILKTKAEKYMDRIIKYDMYLDSNETIDDDISQFIKIAHKSRLYPYIPGSSIKGFIRTALIYNLANKKSNSTIVKVLEDMKINDYKKNIELQKHTKNIAECLYIGDSEPIDAKHLYVTAVKVYNTKRNIKEHAEYIEPNAKTYIDIKEVRCSDKDLLKNWKKSCYEFTRDIIQAEKQYWEKKPEGKKILSFLEKLESENKEDSPVLRIGRFCGKTSVSLSLVKYANIKSPKTRRITSSNDIFGFIKLVPVT